jgi:hypothetical protein
MTFVANKNSFPYHQKAYMKGKMKFIMALAAMTGSMK